MSVTDGGTLSGRVTLAGDVPKPKGYNLTTLPDQFYCGRISYGQGWRILQPFQVGPAGELYHKHMAGAPMKQLVNLSKGRQIFVMQCGFHAYMESWGVAVANPYFAKTDEQGRFTMTDVPPGTYKLIVWHPYIRRSVEQVVTILPKETAQADIVVAAPTGRLYANEVMDHPYIRYNVPQDTQNETRSHDPEANSLKKKT